MLLWCCEVCAIFRISLSVRAVSNTLNSSYINSLFWLERSPTNKKSTDNSSSNRKSIGYIIKVDIDNQELFPFHIQISSLARGKPLQVLKTKDFPKLINLIQGKEKETGLKEVYSHLFIDKNLF